MFHLIQLRSKALRCVGALFLTIPVLALAGTEVLTHKELLQLTQENDYKLKQLSGLDEAYRHESVSSGSLPDPVVFGGIQNVPTDSFELDQEPMTQLRVGVRQMFPKGDTLDIRSNMSITKSQEQQLLREAYWLTRTKEVSQSWLEALYWHHVQGLLNEDKAFLEQLQTFVNSLYEVGAKAQSDYLGAELELVRLEEALIEARRQFERQIRALEGYANTVLVSDNIIGAEPKIEFSYEDSLDTLSSDSNLLRSALAEHPRVKVFDQQEALASQKLDLIEQDFKPSWGLEVSYGFRDGTDAMGNDRPDFLSAGVSIELPLFSQNRPKNSRLAEMSRKRSVSIARDEALEQMFFSYQASKTELDYAITQGMLYEERILPTLAEQVSSAVTEYESGTGNFQRVMELFLQQQKAKTKRLRLSIDEQIHLAAMAYLLGYDYGVTIQ